MRTNLKKIIASSLAVVTVAGALAATSGSAQAKPFPKPIPFHHHHGFGSWGAAGLIGGLALGAVAASAYANDGYDCGRVRQRVYTPDGYFAGYRWVSAC
jgi:hypothetical protein